MASPLLQENVWFQQHKFEDAEVLYRQSVDGATNSPHAEQKVTHSLAGEIAQVRQDIQKALNKQPVSDGGDVEDDAELDSKAANVARRLKALEDENKKIWKTVNELRGWIASHQNLLPPQQVSAQPQATQTPVPQKPAPVPQKPVPAVDDDDDECDLFGSDDEEAQALKEKRLKEYAEKKLKKPGPIAKSSVVLDVKPWDDETDMAEMEKRVRSIEQDGLVWGASKLAPVGYGINKLTIICVVEDDKVSIEDLSEKIMGDNEDLVQSVDIAAFNKI